MLDLKYIRINPDLVKNAAQNKKENTDIEALLQLDGKRRSLLTETESLKKKCKKQRNRRSEAQRRRCIRNPQPNERSF